jgi:hypothetical protein
MHPMKRADIESVFDILVETCGAAPETRYAFVQSIERQLATRAEGRTEPVSFVFGGYLGFGGKVVIDDDAISVTAIDDTPQVHAVVKRANASLARVSSSLGTPTPAIDRYQNGNVRFTGFHLNGEMHGAWTFYRLDGSVMRSGSFDRGRQVGTWTTFSRDGSVVKETVFTDSTD